MNPDLLGIALIVVSCFIFVAGYLIGHWDGDKASRAEIVRVRKAAYEQGVKDTVRHLETRGDQPRPGAHLLEGGVWKLPYEPLEPMPPQIRLGAIYQPRPPLPKRPYLDPLFDPPSAHEDRHDR